MTKSINIRPLARKRASRLHATLATVLAVPVGLGLSIFGVLGWCVGPVILLAGLFGRTFHRRWALWAIWIGAGLALGALVYITLGILTPDGPSSGGGSGVAPH